MAEPSSPFKKVNVEKLKRLRDEHGWSQEELAKRSGLDIRTIQRFEAGHNARSSNIEILAKALHVEAKTLWADYEPSATEPDNTESLTQAHLTTDGAEKDPTTILALAILKQNESLAGELGINQRALANFFKILEQQHVPPEDLDAKLREIAASHKQFQQRLQSIDPDNAESSRLYVEALAAAERGEYASARALLDEAVREDTEEMEVLEGCCNKNLLSKAATSAAKGDSYKTELRYAEAAECYRRGVAFVEQIREGNEREWAIYLSLLGVHLRDQGDFAGAKLCYERALEIRQKVLGPEHPDTAYSLFSIGSLLHAQGHFADAQVYYYYSLEIRQKVLGPEHPDTVYNLSTLGSLRQSMRPREDKPLTQSS